MAWTEWWLSSLFLVLGLTCFSAGMESLSLEKNTFESDFDGWQVDNDSWVRSNVSELKEQWPKLSLPTDPSSHVVVTPQSSEEGSGTSVMSRNITVGANMTLELFFSCLVLGYDTNKDNQSSSSFLELIFRWLNRPVLQVLYDDVLVFNLATAIRENSDKFVAESWNQFRLFSSYASDLNMSVSIVASNGNQGLVVLDNVVIKQALVASDLDEQERDNLAEEPEAELREADNKWAMVETEDEEAEDDFSDTNNDFCSLAPEKGSCKEHFRRFFYNVSAKTCQSFVYSGCDGNANNFHTKLACNTICQRRSNVSSNFSLETNLELDFEKDFEDWQVDAWQQIKFDSEMARKFEIEAPNVKSKKAATPHAFATSIFRRPRMMHTLKLLPDHALLLGFTLKMVGPVSASVFHPFMEHLHPGFKVYIGDTVVFDHLVEGRVQRDQDWHSYKIDLSADALRQDSAINTDIVMVKVYGWNGRDERSLVILDDLSLVQTSRNGSRSSTTPYTSSTSLSSTSSSTSSTSTTRTRTAPSFPCSLSASSGPCRMRLTRWYYDGKKCNNFVYGGCKGNANHFLTQEDCVKKCMPWKLEKSSSSSSSAEDVCLKSASRGNCSSTLERFYFSSTERRCDRFVYSGCGGNGNNFITEAECEHVCHHRLRNPRNHNKETLKRVEADCHLDIDKGRVCSQKSLDVFGYRADIDRCVGFQYSGCGGNANLFFQIDHCQRVCEKQRHKCNATLVAAPSCVSNEKPRRRWSFVSESRECMEIFGCAMDEDSNQFESKADCESACNAIVVDKNNNDDNDDMEESVRNAVNFELKDCLLSVKTGSCELSLKRYYYEAEHDTCHGFEYSGCDGNKNNFESRQECIDTCVGAALLNNKSNVDLARANASVCHLPKLRGPCSQMVRRFYYDVSSASCTWFEYGGCGGNANNFLSVSACEQTCMTPIVEFEVGSLVSEEEHRANILVKLAETCVGLVLVLVLIAAIVFGVKWFGNRANADENYFIFDANSRNNSTEEQNVAYANPLYEDNNAFAMQDANTRCNNNSNEENNDAQGRH